MRSRPALLLIAFAVALNCSACGRRGALQPPGSGATEDRKPSTSAPASSGALPRGPGLASGNPSVDPEAVQSGDELPPSATPASSNDTPTQTSKGAKRGYKIPKDPFILDPLL